MKKFTDKEVDRIQIVYNKFKNAATQIVMQEQYLPIENTVTENNQKESADYIFEPSKIEIISELIPKSLRTQLFKSIRDSSVNGGIIILITSPATVGFIPISDF